MNDTVLQPFSITYTPMHKLALVNFEKNPDEYYMGLELQYLNDKEYGGGYRIIAYRRDQYVDVYDDLTLVNPDAETFNVAGKGLKHYRQMPIQGTVFTKKKGNAHIAFKFTDLYGRRIKVNIKEKSTRSSKGLTLLAPVGTSSEKPTYLPLFFLYDFDFIRRPLTAVEVKIAGKTIELDPFPFPMPKEGQRRYYTRFTLDSLIVEFAWSERRRLEVCEVDEGGIVRQNAFHYTYKDKRLTKIDLQKSRHPLQIHFFEGLPDLQALPEGEREAGTFRIRAEEKAGEIRGSWSASREGNLLRLELEPKEGWIPVPDTFLTKFVFNKKSLFRSWVKTYHYIQEIDMQTFDSVSWWERKKTEI
ncbi:hypothetical protein [Alkalicoccus halolimnae]|uniref:Uncharacterized protein n=1 Tax=Alkalicoccus halolimnae TaxID=1667239 RepID=A0A5C7FF76_9BACI|nr:hypothetical protein [Alkalicoccus halolimnae]TXF84615.1 hypothetical protein FTX54_10460 [Alkalicoccus halolimnae]